MSEQANSSSDRELSLWIDYMAAQGKEFFHACEGHTNAIAAAFLRSCYGADTFCDLSINEGVARILAASSRDEYEKSRAELCAYLAKVARDAAENYVDNVLPEKCQNYRHYAKQDALAENDAMLLEALEGICGNFKKF